MIILIIFIGATQTIPCDTSKFWSSQKKKDTMLSAKSLILAGKYKDFYPMYRNAMNKNFYIYMKLIVKGMGIYHGMSRSANKTKKSSTHNCQHNMSNLRMLCHIFVQKKWQKFKENENKEKSDR